MRRSLALISCRQLGALHMRHVATAAAATALPLGQLGLPPDDQRRVGQLAELNQKSDPLHIARQVRHIASVNSELRVLLPKAAKVLGLGATTKPQAAPLGKSKKSLPPPATTAPTKRLPLTELAARTAFFPETMGAAKGGSSRRGGSDPEAPSLRTLYRNPVFLEAPSPSELRQRLHFLACEHFSHAFAWRSVTTKDAAVQSERKVVDSDFLREAVRSFGSIAEFESRLRTFASSRLQGGFTWVVWNPHSRSGDASVTTQGGQGQPGRLEILNTPRNALPQLFGMWPVLCINMTHRAVLATPADCKSRFADPGTLDAAGNTTAAAPAWSRAARNPAAAKTGSFAIDDEPQHIRPLTVQRDAYISYCMQHIDFEFAAAQLQRGVAYYTSPERQQRIEKRANDLEVAAVSAAIARYKAIDHESVGGDGGAAVEVGAASTAPAAEGGAVASDAQGVPAPAVVRQDEEPPSAASAALAAAAAAEEGTLSARSTTTTTTSTSEGSSSSTSSSSIGGSVKVRVVVQESAPDADGTIHSTYSDGAQEWRAADGNVTMVLADATQIFTTPTGERTTVRPDGSQLFEYTNGTSIELRDGLQITRYADGQEVVEKVG